MKMVEQRINEAEINQGELEVSFFGVVLKLLDGIRKQGCRRRESEKKTKRAFEIFDRVRELGRLEMCIYHSKTPPKPLMLYYHETKTLNFLKSHRLPA